MVATKVILFGTLLLLGALNFQIARSPSGGAVIASLKRFGEAELGIGITIILTAASLTSLPPAIDLKADRVSRQEIAARLAPQIPRLASPTVQDLPEDVYAAEVKSFDAGTLSSASFVPGQAGTRPNTPAEKSWSEYNHHWAGLIVLAIGLLAFLAQTKHFPWARNWPLLFLGLSLFLFLRSDPETWPLGPNGFWVTLQDPEVLLHRIFSLLVIGLAIFEWRVQTGRVATERARLIFPALVAVASGLLLTHSHSLGNIKEEVLAELSHAPLAILGVVAGWSRWLELRSAIRKQSARQNGLAVAHMPRSNRSSTFELPRNVTDLECGSSAAAFATTRTTPYLARANRHGTPAAKYGRAPCPILQRASSGRNSPSHRATTTHAKQFPSTFTAVRPISIN